MRIEEHVPLNDKNWFRTGGPARFYCEPKTNEDFTEALSFASNKKLPLFILGKGANILISDDGFDGLVVHPQSSAMRIISPKKFFEQTQISIEFSDEDLLIEAQAGTSIDNLIEFCLENNAIGLEAFSYIPGTVGGSVFINIHYFEYLLSDFLIAGNIAHKKTNLCAWHPAPWFEFGYDTSKLQTTKDVLVSAIFRLKKATDTETAFARGRRHEIIRHRTRRYPSQNTCGSFFRNFHPEELTPKNNVSFVAHYLETVGVKGELSYGAARVFEKHANMIVTGQAATSSDVIACARTMQQRVYKTFGIMPQPECQLVGFKKHPLFT